MKVDVIIPTWNSMPEFEFSLESIRNAIPPEIINDIIVIDRDSTDGTREFAEEHGCVLLTDTVSLGSARLKGIIHASTEWILFVDSDIILPEDWLANVISYTLSDRVGWVSGKAIDDDETGRYKMMKMREKWDSIKRILKRGERGYTHNSLIRRKPLLTHLDPQEMSSMNAWEDALMTKAVQEAGYDVIEVLVACTHMRHETYGKWDSYTVRWNMAGEIRHNGRRLRQLYDSLWWIKNGISMACHTKNPSYVLDGMKQFIDRISAWMRPEKYMEIDRRKT